MTKISNKTLKPRGILSYISGEIVAEGPAPYDLPINVTTDFVSKLFSYKKEHPMFLPVIAADLTSHARSKLLQSCRNMGGEYWKAYRSAALKWASLTSDDGVWHLDKFFLVYEAEVAAPFVDRLVISDRNIRLVHTPVGWLTFAEFVWRYEENVEDHLKKYLSEKQREHDKLCDHIKSIIDHAVSDLVLAPLIVAGPQGVEKREFIGLQVTEKKLWPLPGGLTFLDEPEPKGEEE